MKIKKPEGVMKFKESDVGCSVHDFWRMALDMYQMATYCNDIDVVINPDEEERKHVISFRFKQ